MPRHILVHVWCEIDPTINVRIDRQSGEPQPEPGDRLWRVSPWGRANVAAALSLEDARVTAVAVGSGHAEALRHALAAGASAAVELMSPDETSPPSPADLLAAYCKGQRAVLLIGDRTCGQVAGRLGWAHLAGIAGLRIEAGRLHAIRYLEKGAREEVAATLPAAIRLQSEAIAPPYVSRGRLRQASLGPIERDCIVETGEAAGFVAGPLKPTRARTRTAQTPRSTSSRGADRLAALIQPGTAPPARAAEPAAVLQTPDEMAEQFVRYLRHHDLLQGDPGPNYL